jgi:hypothetical protein
MPKQRPPGTTTHTIFLPAEVHKQVTSVAGYGEVDDLIVECVTEAMKPRWGKWLKQQAKQIGYDLVVDSPNEGVKKEVRPDSRENAQGGPGKTLRSKAKPAT